MKEPVVLARTEAGHVSRSEADAYRAWGALLLVGVALAIVGATDVLLLFVPARLASLDWEFGTISSVIDGMPLVTIGCGAMAAGMVARGWWGGRRAFAVLLLLIALAVVGMLVVFALDAPLALRAVTPAVRPNVQRAVLKTATMGVTYFGLYTLLGVWMWRRGKREKGV